MKTTLKLVFAIVFVALCNSVSAQTPRLAHIDMQELIFSMPSYDSAMVVLQRFGEDLESELELMTVELNRAYEEFERLQESWTELTRQSRFSAIQDMSQRIQIFQQRAQEVYQQEFSRLLQPIQERANRAVNTVRDEQGIMYVFNSQAVISMSRDAIDLLPAVRQHLGIR